MAEIKVSNATPIRLALRNEDGTPATAITFAAGDLRVLKPGGSWTNFAGSSPTHSEDGVWTYTPTTTEMNTIGETLIKFVKASFEPHIRTISVVAELSGVVASIAADAITATAIQANAITAAKIATDAIGSAQIASSAVTEIQSGLATSAGIAAGVPVASIAANAITATAIATDAITAAKIATDAVTEIQSGLATASGVAGVQADTDAIQAALASGVTVSALGANTVTAAALATDAVTEIQTGLATASAVSAIAASLSAGVSVASIAANAITAAATASDFLSELTTAIDASLSGVHGSGSWEGGGGGGGGATAEQVWQYVIEGGFSAEQLVRLIVAAVLNNASGLEGSTPAYRDIANSKNRIVASYTAGTRVVTTRDGT